MALVSLPRQKSHRSKEEQNEGDMQNERATSLDAINNCSSQFTGGHMDEKKPSSVKGLKKQIYGSSLDTC